MTDHYHGSRTRLTRPVLWVLLAICAVCNMVTSTADINPFIGVGFGLATAACAATLIVQHYRSRPR